MWPSQGVVKSFPKGDKLDLKLVVEKELTRQDRTKKHSRQRNHLCKYSVSARSWAYKRAFWWWYWREHGRVSEKWARKCSVRSFTMKDLWGILLYLKMGRYWRRVKSTCYTIKLGVFLFFLKSLWLQERKKDWKWRRETNLNSIAIGQRSWWLGLLQSC